MISLKPYVIALLAISALFCGCCISVPVDGPDASPSPGVVDSKVVSASSMADIDAALEKGPALVKFGSESCFWCVQMAPVLDELSIMYPGIAVLDVDTSVSRELIRPFYISSIPQTDIIVRKNADGTYLYVDKDGKPSDNVPGSRIIGYQTAGAFKKPLEAALSLRNSS